MFEQVAQRAEIAGGVEPLDDPLPLFLLFVVRQRLFLEPLDVELADHLIGNGQLQFAQGIPSSQGQHAEVVQQRGEKVRIARRGEHVLHPEAVDQLRH